MYRSSKGTSPVGGPAFAYRLLDFFGRVGIGKTKGYEEIRNGRLRVVKCGRLTLVTQKSAEDFITLLEQEAANADTNKDVGRDS
jgi:hypothetical protein